MRTNATQSRGRDNGPCEGLPHLGDRTLILLLWVIGIGAIVHTGLRGASLPGADFGILAFGAPAHFRMLRQLQITRFGVEWPGARVGGRSYAQRQAARKCLRRHLTSRCGAIRPHMWCCGEDSNRRRRNQ